VTIRKTLFWLHLVAGLVAGVVIFIMSITGVALAYEKDLIDWAERDARRVDAPGAPSERLSLEVLRERFALVYPDKTPSGLTVLADPRDAVAVNVGRGEVYYIDPYTGTARQPASDGMSRFMRTMIAWHRWLGQDGDGRAIGKAITGACNLAFIVLAVTGLILWWPAAWRWPALRRSLIFVRSETTKARDWNWHNTIGFWCLIPIVVMAVTATVFSYRWAGNAIYQIVGEEPPTRGGPPRGGDTATAAVRPAPVIDLDGALAAVTAHLPNWSSVSLSLPIEATASASVKVPDSWPRTASTSLTIDAATGAITQTADFSDQSAGQQIRGWVRYLHTGEALGWLGQLVAGLGSLGGCFLVYTGFALSWRRFFGKKSG